MLQTNRSRAALSGREQAGNGHSERRCKALPVHVSDSQETEMKPTPARSEQDQVHLSNRPAFYQPPPRWRGLAALIGAIALEAAAVAVAGLHQPEPATFVDGFQEPAPAEVYLTEVPPESTPPPDQIPPPMPLPPTQPNEFILEVPATPPPGRENRATKSNPPVVKANKASFNRVSLTSPESSMLAAPRPSYPYEARRARKTGSGKFLLRFNPAGQVIEVRVVRSTGSDLLDQVTLRSLQEWRRRPGLL